MFTFALHGGFTCDHSVHKSFKDYPCWGYQSLMDLEEDSKDRTMQRGTRKVSTPTPVNLPRRR